VTSALPSAVARRRCPHAVFLPGDHQLYSAVSREVHEIFRRFTPIVEPLALDEAFLDVTGAIRLFGDGVAIAHTIRDDVRAELDLGCSVGVASNKFLAKLASVEAKPVARPDRIDPGPGVVEVVAGRELEFLHPLPVERLWGVGPVTLERLRRLGIHTVADLASIDESAVIASLGKANGAHLIDLSRGIDSRPVEVDRELKSIGHEETFAHDLHERDDLDRELVRLCDAVASRLRHGRTGARTLTLKVRFAGFETITRSTTRTEPVDTGPSIVSALRPLLDRIDPTPGVRLLGVSTSNFGEPVRQLSLLERDDECSAPASSTRRAAGAVDEIRDRFGALAIGPASSVGRDGLRLVRPGAQQWGPHHDVDRGVERGVERDPDRPTR
jgi:DNA polymerase-4